MEKVYLTKEQLAQPVKVIEPSHISVDAPEFGEGAQVMFRTNLTVDDYINLSQSVSLGGVFAIKLFVQLAVDPVSGGPLIADEDFESFADSAAGIPIAKIMARSGLAPKVVAQLAEVGEEVRKSNERYAQEQAKKEAKSKTSSGKRPIKKSDGGNQQ